MSDHDNTSGAVARLAAALDAHAPFPHPPCHLAHRATPQR